MPCTAFFHPFLLNLEVPSRQSRWWLPLLLQMQVQEALAGAGCSKHTSLWLIHFSSSALTSYTSPRCCSGALCLVPSLELLGNVLIKCHRLGLGCTDRPGVRSCETAALTAPAQPGWASPGCLGGGGRFFSAPSEPCGVLFVPAACW